jgi:hypothetical protein
MVGEEEVTDINEYRDLQESEGEKRSLKPRGNFEQRPHLLTYFIRSADAIKIGQSGAPRLRMESLQSAHSSRLELLVMVPDSRLSEVAAHRMFKHLRMHGEWFRPDQELLDFIEALKAEAAPLAPPPQLPTRKRQSPATPVDMMIAKLTAARPSAPAHKRYHISNLIEQLRNHAGTKDPNIRSFLERAMARSMTHIEAA